MFTDISVVGEEDQGEISTSESILTTVRVGQAGCGTLPHHTPHSCLSGWLSEKKSKPTEADRNKVKRSEGKDMERKTGWWLQRFTYSTDM